MSPARSSQAADALHLLKAYTSKQTLATSIHVSNYGGADISGGTIDWKLVSNSSSGEVRPRGLRSIVFGFGADFSPFRSCCGQQDALKRPCRSDRGARD